MTEDFKTFMNSIRATAVAKGFAKTLDSLRPLTAQEVKAALASAEPQPMTYRRYDSLNEFMAPRGMSEANIKRMCGSLNDDTPISWFGMPSADACVDALRNGWPEGAHRLQDAVGRLAPSLTADVASIKRRRLRSDQGDSYDIHRAYSGGLDRAWQTTRRQSRTTIRAVTILAQSSMLGDVPSQVLFWRGAAALLLIEALNDAGYSTEVHIASKCLNYNSGGGRHRVACVKLKDADAPTDIERLAAGLCMAGVHRVGMFLDRASMPHTASGGMGESRDIDADDVQALDLPGDTIVVPRGSLQDEASAVRWLQKTLEALRAA